MTTAHSTAGTRMPLLTADPELGNGMSAERRAAAAGLVVEIHHLWPGVWRRPRDPDDGSAGLLLLEGVVARRLGVADTVGAELLGSGDLMRPWQSSTGESLLPVHVRWSVLSPATVALLDGRVVAQAAEWPEIACALLDRLAKRADRIATMRAIGRLTGVDRRLLALFWHLAERWGRVQRNGVVVPLSLTHRLLGQLVGAHRPTVTAALKLLADRRALVRTFDGSWLLPRSSATIPLDARSVSANIATLQRRNAARR